MPPNPEAAGSAKPAPTPLGGRGGRDRHFLGDFSLYFLSLIVSLLVRLIARTLRYQWVGRECLEAAQRSGRPIIFAFWHEDLISMAIFRLRIWRGPVAVMVSRSRDGERLAHVLARFGAESVRASSSRGAVAGLVELKRWLIVPGRQRVAAMALDGPRGPRREAKPGFATLASHAGALIVPMAFRHSRQIVFHSWDRTRLPKPFSRMRGLFGEPLDPAAHPLEAATSAATLTALLNDLHARLEQDEA
jgi:lysophospholipid acyltransferase (LPLAT)-like uncharacterized protein